LYDPYKKFEHAITPHLHFKEVFIPAFAIVTVCCYIDYNKVEN